MARTASILIVDDDPDVCEAVADFLQYHGYHTTRSGTGAESLSQLARYQFGAVLLNLGLPDMDGISVLGRMQALAPSMPVIILTGRDSPETKQEALRCGAFAFLHKPFDRHVLTTTLARATASVAGSSAASPGPS